MIYTLLFLSSFIFWFLSFLNLFRHQTYAYEDSDEESAAILSHLVQVNSEWMDKH